MKTLRKKNNEQARKLWMQAYRTGCVTLDYTKEIGGEELTTKMHYFLRNFRTYHKRYPMKDIALLEQMQCCQLKRIGNTIIQIERKRLSSKSIGINTLLQSPSVTDVLEPINKSDKVLKLFTMKFNNQLTQDEAAGKL